MLLPLHFGVQFITQAELILVVLRSVKGLVEVVPPQTISRAIGTVEYWVEFQTVLVICDFERPLSMGLLL